MTKEHTLEIWEVERGRPDLHVVTVTGPHRESVEAEAAHYAVMYGQDGPVEIREPKS